MKLNRNYCLIGILVLVILYCCLGPNIFEGLDNESKSDKTNNGDNDNNGDNNNSQSTNSAPTGKGSQTSKGQSLNGQSYDTTDPCDTGMIWNSVTGKCENDDTLSKLKSNIKNYGSDISGDIENTMKSLSSDMSNLFNNSTSQTQPVQSVKDYSSNISGDVENTMKSLSSDMSNLFNNSTSQTPSGASNFMGTPSPTAMPVSRSQIPPGKEDQYILKSEIVPPVCPACPPQLACPSKAKCPPCPPPEPVQPCPPCARCPESPFTCKKVPDYSSPSVGQVLPRPMLNDFSQF